jgi:hypothetical protein
MDGATWNSILIACITGLFALCGVRSAVGNIKSQLGQEREFHLIELKNKLYSDSIVSLAAVPSLISSFSDFDKPLQDSAKLFSEHTQTLLKLQLISDVDIIQILYEYNELCLDAFLDIGGKRIYIESSSNTDVNTLLKQKLSLNSESMLYVSKLLEIGCCLTLKLKADFGYPSKQEALYKKIINENSQRSMAKINSFQKAAIEKISG